MARSQSAVRTKRWRHMASKTLAVTGDGLVLVAFGVHFRVFKRGTYFPIKRILECTTDTELRHELRQWCKYKEREVGYVQVAGAVMFASVTSCLSWNTLEDRHWSGPALWYGTIILSLSCIFTGAQQSLVLPEPESVDQIASEELQRMKLSFSANKRQLTKPSAFALFAWQLPIMLLGYTVISFVGGLCSVVLSPLALNPGWNKEAKTSILFLSISLFALICWIFPSPFVHRIRSAKNGLKYEDQDQ